MNHQANSLVLVVVFYVEHSHLDFLYVTVYETFVKLIRSDKAIFFLKVFAQLRLHVTAIRSNLTKLLEKY